MNEKCLLHSFIALIEPRVMLWVLEKWKGVLSRILERKDKQIFHGSVLLLYNKESLSLSLTRTECVYVEN
jgi:hypothetical protein